MKIDDPRSGEQTYPLRTAARLTALSPALLRAWEQRYGAVQPLRTPGGTRRYRTRDIERLRLLKAAVDAGHRIGQIARLDLAELRDRAGAAKGPPGGRMEQILAALDRLDGVEAQRLLSLQLAALGPVRFARELVSPLVREIGDRWAGESMAVASEHLATGLVRSMLGSALQPTPVSLLGPRVLFATPTGERHELGLLMAALTAVASGANALYLGPDLPVDELLGAVDRSGAAAVALSLVLAANPQAEQAVRALAGGLPRGSHLWLGGAGAAGLEPLPGIEHIPTLEELEQRVLLLVAETAGARG